MLVRNLWRRKIRTILTLLGIAVGIAVLVTLVALSRGVVTGYMEVTNRSDAHVILQAVQGPGQAMTFGNTFDESLVLKVRALPEVKDAAAVFYSVIPIGGRPFFIIFGYEPDQIGIRHFKIVEGVSLAGYTSRQGGKPLILGKTAADSLKKKVGDTIRLKEITFRVVGIYETGTALEDAACVISLRDAQALANAPGQIMFIGIRLHRPGEVDAFKARLAKMLPKDVEIAGTQVGGQMLEMLELLDIFAWAIAMVAALVGGVGMMNTMLMSVYERTREIGVLRAVGWSPWRVYRMILGESLLLSLLGGALGLALGAGMVWLVVNLGTMAALSRTRITPTLAVQALSTALVLGTVGGLYPAWRASRLMPVEALSYDGGSGRRRGAAVPVGGMALRNLTRQRTRTALTLVGVGIGVLGMLLMGSLTEGFPKSFNSIFSASEITAVEAGLADTSLSAIDERIVSRIEARPDVKYAVGMQFAFVSTPETPLFTITARPRNDPTFDRRSLREGTLINGPRQCLLGWRAAREQNKKVGDRISFLGTSFRIVGIVETTNSYENGGAIIDLREAQQLLKKPRQVMLVQIKLEDPRQADAVLASLSAEYPKLLFSKSAEFTENLPDMENMYRIYYAMFILTVVVGSIALMNTMVMSVYERTREIGVLRAVGWRRWLVLRLMLVEALLQSILSGAAGFVFTVGVIWVMQIMPALGVYRDIFALSPTLVLQVLVLSVILGMLGGFYPAWHATKLSPVEALRYE